MARLCLDAARQAGIDIHSACGGEGNCGQCQVVILAGKTNPITPDDEFFLSADELAQGYRLACRTEVLDDSENPPAQGIHGERAAFTG